MGLSLVFELEGIRDKLECGDEESIAIALSVVDRLLASVVDEPEEHLRRLRKELNDLDIALAVCDHKAEKEGDERVRFYRLPCGPWHRMLALRQNVVALSGALAAGKPTVPCPMCHRWVAAPTEDVPEHADGRVAMRCPDGHEWQLSVINLPADMRGEKALAFLPRPRKGDSDG